MHAASSPVRDGDPVTNRTELLVNRNGLQDNQFVFTIQTLEHLPYFVTSVNVPGLNIGDAILSTPLKDVGIPGDKIVFEPLIMRYKVDERLECFLELQRWMRGLGFSESHRENDALRRGWSGRETLDCGISIPTNPTNHEGLYVHFRDCWPTAMEGLEFDAGSGQSELVSTATFSYTTYDIYSVPDGQPMVKLVDGLGG